MSENILERNILDGFIEAEDVVESNQLAITDFGNLAIVYQMKSGKRLIEVTNMNAEDLPFQVVEPTEDPV